MIRVLEVIYGFGYGGIRAFIMNYLTYLNKDKFSIDIYVYGCESSPFTEQVEQLGGHIFFQPENNVRNIPRYVCQLKDFIDEHGPYDVVHANTNLIGAWDLLAAKLAHVPIRLSHSHTSSHFRGSTTQNIYSYLRRGMMDILATKKLSCGQLAGEAMYGTGSKFEIVANGIPVERFINKNTSAISEMRAKLHIPEGVKVYANVTRMDTSKNHIFALEVFKEIHKIEPDSIFLYGGVTPTVAPTVSIVKKKIVEYGLEDYCIYTGPVMGIESLYHLTDLWIYCSAYEGLPFGPIELQAASVPVLASDVITREIDLGLGLVQFLSLNDDPKKWAQVAVDTKKTQLPEKQTLDSFKSYHFDIRVNVKKLEQIYEGK